FHQIAPILCPPIEERAVFGFHELIADLELSIDPARNVIEAIGHHPAFFAKSAINRGRVFEMFGHHVKHRCFCSGGRAARNLDFFSRHGCRYSYLSSSFVFAKASTANSKSSRECAALTRGRTRPPPCGTNRKKKPITQTPFPST